MTYLLNTSDPQLLVIPRPGETPAGDLILRITSTVDLRTVLETPVTDLGTGSLYHAFDISLTDGIPDGEYEYRLTAGGSVAASGVLVVGDYTDEVTEYNKPTTYEQYPTE